MSKKSYSGWGKGRIHATNKKGQTPKITIPKELIKKLNWKDKDELYVEVYYTEGKIVITKR